MRPVAGSPEAPPPEVLPPDPQPASTVDVMTAIAVAVMSDAFRRDNVVRIQFSPVDPSEPLRLPGSCHERVTSVLRNFRNLRVSV